MLKKMVVADLPEKARDLTLMRAVVTVVAVVQASLVSQVVPVRVRVVQAMTVTPKAPVLVVVKAHRNPVVIRAAVLCGRKKGFPKVNWDA
jgi:hypothetical protein